MNETFGPADVIGAAHFLKGQARSPRPTGTLNPRFGQGGPEPLVWRGGMRLFPWRQGLLWGLTPPLSLYTHNRLFPSQQVLAHPVHRDGVARWQHWSGPVPEAGAPSLRQDAPPVRPLAAAAGEAPEPARGVYPEESPGFPRLPVSPYAKRREVRVLQWHLGSVL